MLRYVSSRSGIHTVQDTELGVEKTFTNAELYAELKATGSIAGLFFDSDGNIWSVLGFKIVDAYYMNGETAPAQEESISATISEETISEPVVEEPVSVEESAIAEEPVTDFRDEPVGPIDTTPKTGYMYLGMVDDLHRVKDLSDGVVDELSDTELRNALSQVGQIHGIYFDGDDNIRALTGQVIVRAIEEATAEEFVDVSTDEPAESSSEEPAEPTGPKYQYTYMTGRDNVHKVKDLTTGEVEECDDATLRQAYNAGLIEGLVMYDDGSIWDLFGVLRVDAPKAATRNNKLHTAKREKKDEFYTQLADIEKELDHYKDEFKDKVIYCPTDVAVNTCGTRQSQFVHYFQMHAHELQFKRLIATCLVDKATGENDAPETVQNCYVLERMIVPEAQRNIYGYMQGRGRHNPVVGEISDFGLKYVTLDDLTHPIPYHIVNQAVTDAEGRIKLIKRYIDHYDEVDGHPVVSEEYTGVNWVFDGHTVKYKWCRLHPDGTVEVLPDECYFFSREDLITDFSVLPKDENGESCVESVNGGVVALYPPEYYDYVESDYALYSWHCPVAETDYYVEKGQRIKMESGDFRTAYCKSLLQQSDIVVTNPPFSLFRSFINWVIPEGKKFITLADQNCITYKEVFPLIRDNKMWIGTQTGITSMMFEVPSDYPVPDYAVEWCRKHTTPEYFAAHRLTYIRGISWFTNIDLKKRHEPMKGLSKEDLEAKGVVFSKYDNYDALNIDKLDQIPMDYTGVMGVPITFLYKYCPEQFEIVAFRKDDNGSDLVFTTEREHEFARTFGQLFDGITWSDYRSKMDDVLRRKEQICQDSNSTEDMKFFAEYICRHFDLAELALKQRESSGYLSADSHQSTERSGERLHSSGSQDICENAGSPCKLLTEQTELKRESSCRVILSVQDANTWCNEQSEGYSSKREVSVCKSSYSEKIVSIFFKASTNLLGVIKNTEGQIDGKITYARILIRAIK